jgi:uncharacterized protein with von Willebrand factor type A (vWA) domain
MYCMIDASGSMAGHGQRIAGGVLLNRLQAVARDEAELYYQTFEGRPNGDEVAVLNPESARERVRKLQLRAGGGTDTDAAIREADKRVKEIQTQRAVARPQIIVITDGCDTITVKADQFPGTKIHAVMIGMTNEELRKLAQQSGGISLTIPNEKINQLVNVR